jgi:hypothetical protein
MRVALLVSTRSGPSYEAILRAFATSNLSYIFRSCRYPTIKVISIDTAHFHRSSEETAFVRSFSVCLVPYDIWTDDAKTLLHKLSCGTYWEYLGAGKHMAGDCLGWEKDRIKTIDSVLELGLCAYTNEIISRECKWPHCQCA